jgi:hypothetical protein
MAFGKQGAGFSSQGATHLGRTGTSHTGSPYTLVAGTGSFILTGEDMTPQVNFNLPAAVGAFTLTGVDATLTYVPVAGRQFADLSIYRNAGTSRSFANYDHYVAA